jgi:antirestriction protein ArdC
MYSGWKHKMSRYANKRRETMSNYQKITDQILAQMETVGAGWICRVGEQVSTL